MPIPERHNPSFALSRALASATEDRLQAARERLIIALDVPDAANALTLVNRLEGACSWFKVGLELYVAAGPAILEPLIERGHSVFLDLKFHDIPNTVAGAVRSAAALGVRMLTVHAGGGPAMLAAAAPVAWSRTIAALHQYGDRKSASLLRLPATRTSEPKPQCNQ